MANAYVNKVVQSDGTVLIDISDATATADKILEGYTAYGATGEKLTGTATGGTVLIQDTIDAAGGTVTTITATNQVHIQNNKRVTPTSTDQTITPDTGYDALGSVIVEGVTNKGIIVQDTVDAAGGTIREITAQEISGTLSITQNGTYDVTQYESAEVNVSGGSVGYFQLLNTITVAENVHAINVVFSDYANRELLIVTDLTLSQSDWMYYVRNGTEPSGGVYDSKTVAKNGVAFMRLKNPSNTNSITSYLASGSGYNGNTNTVNNFYMYPYYEETMILAGGKIYIYGGRTI